jgi:hypothetical protein
MKSLIAIAGIYFASVAVSSAIIITFDNLITSPLGTIPMPAGYEGFQWTGFKVVNGESGVLNAYHNAVVSPDNVAGNIDGRSATISSSTAFNLDSAYLTAVFVDSLDLKVEGFVGTTLTYDNTYFLNKSDHRLIDFNYIGVDEVEFITSGGINPVVGVGPDIEDFAMDNLNISVPDASTTSSLLGIAFIGMGILRLRLSQLT